MSGKLVLKGELDLLSPLLIGSGKRDDDVDVCILKDHLGKPIIPATTLVGILRHRFEKQVISFEDLDSNNFKLLKRYFWGESYEVEDDVNKSCQSALIVDEAILIGDSFKIRVRDGVRINPKTSTAQSKCKYDYEILEPGCKFSFNCEVNIRNQFNRSFFLAVIQWIANEMANLDFSLGAMTNKGLGRCRLINWKVYDYDFSNNKSNDAIAWLKCEPPNKIYNDDFLKDNSNPYNSLKMEKAKAFKLEAQFKVKNSIIIRDYSGNPDAVDAVHIKSNGKPILPGTSISGTVRARAEKIINTLGSNGNELVKPLFGWVDRSKDKENKTNPIRGKIIVEEIELNNFAEEIQYRIKIDRFTGGVIKGALFDSMPIWSKDGIESMATLEISIKDYEYWEAGLMLMVLKDLWNGDLAIGGEKNVGRGVLQGLSATITCDDQIIEMKQVGEELLVYRQGYNPSWDKEAAKILEEKVEALLKHIEEKGSGVKLNA